MKKFLSLTVVLVFLTSVQGRALELLQDQQPIPVSEGQPIKVQIVEPENPDFHHRISFGPLGLLVGVANFTWEIQVAKRASFELSPWGIYFGFGGDKLYGGSVGLGAAFYLTGNAPEGLRISLAVAPGAITADPEEADTSSETVFLFGARVMFGYNWVWKSGFSIGLSGGAQYFYFKADSVDSALNGILPAVDFNLGFCF